MNTRNTTDERIRWQNSLTNANTAYATFIGNSTTTLAVLKEEITNLANFFYNIEPEVTELDKTIDACTTLEELESLKDIIKHTDSISMYNKWNEAKLKMK